MGSAVERRATPLDTARSTRRGSARRCAAQAAPPRCGHTPAAPLTPASPHGAAEETTALPSLFSFSKAEVSGFYNSQRNASHASATRTFCSSARASDLDCVTSRAAQTWSVERASFCRSSSSVNSSTERSSPSSSNVKTSESSTRPSERSCSCRPAQNKHKFLQHFVQ